MFFDSFSKRLVAFERKQCHESGTLDRFSHSVLADRGATCFAPSDDTSVAIDQLFQQLNVFVIDEHRAWPFAINVQGVFPRCASFRFRFTTV